jgi:hypothetical protein
LLPLSLCNLANKPSPKTPKSAELSAKAIAEKPKAFAVRTVARFPKAPKPDAGQARPLSVGNGRKDGCPRGAAFAPFGDFAAA